MKLDCVPKDFVRRRFVLAIFAIRSEIAYSRFSAINFISPQRSNAEQNPLVRTFIILQIIHLPSYSFNVEAVNPLQRIKLHAHRNRQFKTRDTYNNTSPHASASVGRRSSLIKFERQTARAERAERAASQVKTLFTQDPFNSTAC